MEQPDSTVDASLASTVASSAHDNSSIDVEQTIEDVSQGSTQEESDHSHAGSLTRHNDNSESKDLNLHASFKDNVEERLLAPSGLAEESLSSPDWNSWCQHAQKFLNAWHNLDDAYKSLSFKPDAVLFFVNEGGFEQPIVQSGVASYAMRFSGSFQELVAVWHQVDGSTDALKNESVRTHGKARLAEAKGFLKEYEEDVYAYTMRKKGILVGPSAGANPGIHIDVQHQIEEPITSDDESEVEGSLDPAHGTIESDGGEATRG